MMDFSFGRTICVECEDMHASVVCNQCGDAFCTLCFQWQHQRGTRATHSYTSLEPENPQQQQQQQLGSSFQPSTAASSSSASSLSPADPMVETSPIGGGAAGGGGGGGSFGVGRSSSDGSVEEGRGMGAVLSSMPIGPLEGEPAAAAAAAGNNSTTSGDAADERRNAAPGTTEYFLQIYRDRGDLSGGGAPPPPPPEDDEEEAALLRANRRDRMEDQSDDSDDRDADDEDDDEEEMRRRRLRKTRGAQFQRVDRGEALETRALYIPLRISEEERVLLHLLQGTLEVSEYTDRVDVTSAFGYGWTKSKPKTQIIQEELVEVFQTLVGMAVCDNLNMSQSLLTRSFADNEEFFKRVFEVGRRYKISNPQKMRSTYGKMMWMLQDTIAYDIPADWSCVAPLNTVNTFLKHKNALDILQDDRLVMASSEIVADNKTRAQVAAEVEQKRQAAISLRRDFSDRLKEEEVDLVISSIADANAFLAANRLPVDKMIDFLLANFNPERPESSRHSLTIRYGLDGSKLSHDHHTQFTFVHQSLVLWREIMHEMYRLWIATENDLLSDRCRYSLWNTGQGLNRVQSAPAVGTMMHRILSRVQSEVRGWVGLSVVHLGDRDVPNALVFIDKYLQVPRILAPICKVIESLPQLYAQRELRAMIDQNFGGLDELRKDILADYFKHGFDGSGSDGGSCIDGRLTSSWNWCSLIEKKPFGHIFNLAGFQGFDGDFRK